MKSIKKSGNFIIMDLLLLVYFITLIYPPISAIFNPLIIRLACMAGWICISFLNKRSFYAKGSIHVTYVIIFYAATVIIPYMLSETTIGNRYLALGMIPMGYFIFCYYKECGRLKDLRSLFLITTIFIILTYFDTLNALIDNPYTSRSIKSSGDYSNQLAADGIGGYSFVYFMVVVSVLLLYSFLKSRNRWLKILTLTGFIMALYFILKSNYTTALITALISVSTLIMLNYAKKGIGNNILLFFILIAFYGIIMNLNAIIESLSYIIPSRIAQAVVPEQNESVFQSVADEFLSARWPSMLKSINAFLNAPLLGLVGSGELEYSNGYLQGFGQHSHILDTFALLGGLFGIVNIFVVLRPLKDNKGKWITYGKPINIAMLICMMR